MNINFCRDMVLSTLENYIKQIELMEETNKNSYSKVYKSLKDSISLINSLGDMNIEETNEYFRLLMAAISASIIIK